MSGLLVPKDFKIPEVLETDKFRVRMLTINDLIKDYDAVMSSVDHLKGVFGERSTWPTKDLTIEQDLVDLGWHQKEFQTRSSFTYAVMSLDEKEELGCVYIFPSRDPEFEVQIYMWVRQSEFEKGLDSVLFETVKAWIEKEWLFKKVFYPGRE